MSSPRNPNNDLQHSTQPSSKWENKTSDWLLFLDQYDVVKNEAFFYINNERMHYENFGKPNELFVHYPNNKIEGFGFAACKNDKFLLSISFSNDRSFKIVYQNSSAAIQKLLNPYYPEGMQGQFSVTLDNLQLGRVKEFLNLVQSIDALDDNTFNELTSYLDKITSRAIFDFFNKAKDDDLGVSQIDATIIKSNGISYIRNKLCYVSDASKVIIQQDGNELFIDNRNQKTINIENNEND